MKVTPNNDQEHGVFSQVTHVIFDFDGLLMDTENVFFRATQKVIAPYGKTFTWEQKSQIMGMPPRPACQKTIDMLNLPLSLDEFIRLQDIEIDREMPNADLMPGAIDIIRYFKKNGIPMAIATGSPKQRFGQRTVRWPDIFAKKVYFDHIVFSGDDSEVKQGKPAPDVFLVAAKRFLNPPEDYRSILVFEDAPVGVHGALAAGMQVVMIPDKHLCHNSTPTLLLESLAHFDPQLFGLPPM